LSRLHSFNEFADLLTDGLLSEIVEILIEGAEKLDLHQDFSFFMTASRLTFFLRSTDFIIFDNARSSNSSSDTGADDMPSLASKSIKNLYSLWLFAVTTTPFIRTKVRKKRHWW